LGIRESIVLLIENFMNHISKENVIKEFARECMFLIKNKFVYYNMYTVTKAL